MKNKVFGLLVFGIFAFAVFASFASASTISVSSTSLTFNHLTDINPLTITNSAASSVTVNLPTQIIGPQSTGPNSKTVGTLSFFSDSGATNPINTAVISANSSKTIYVEATPDPTYFELGGNAVITDSLNSTNIANFFVNFQGTLGLSIEDTNIIKGYGSNSDWYPFDSIEVKADITNNGPDRINTIIPSYGLYDTQHGKWIVKGQLSSFSLNEGNDKTVTIDFNLTSISNLDSNNENNYQFYVWANGKDTQFTNSDKTYSSSSPNSVSVVFDSDFVVLNNLQFVQSPVACGAQAEVTADVVNIGSDDQSTVAVKAYNAALGLNQQIPIGDINSLEKGSLDYTFTIPQGVSEGNYPILFTVIDSNGNVFENSNNDLSQFTGTLNVSGSCVYNPQLTVTASSTTATAGQEVDVTASITNTATTTRTFLVTATNYQNWASLAGTNPISPTSITLSPAQTGQVLVKLNVNPDVSGDQTFNVQLTGDGKIIPQPVTVTIQKTGGFFSFLSGNAIGGNGYLWAIGALNVILLVIIIVVAVRVSRRK
ncbi:MAG TPA: putative S-layer protein [Patescibacteria group bacterium]|nr:putative S-layer protein [Patescibacteria group bacterium]